MGTEQRLYVGVGKYQVMLDDACLPIDNFVEVRDPLYARVLLLENRMEGHSKRYGILSLDVTNMYAGGIDIFREILEEYAGVNMADAWITVTHNFTTPHIWQVPKEGESDVPRPSHAIRTEEEIARSRNTNKAFFTAAIQASAMAAEHMQPALCGADDGLCHVNASRNMRTREGWWLGCDAEEFSDHTVSVLKFETPEGEPIALLYTYDCQSSVMGKSVRADGTKRMTSDLLGLASTYVEREYGENFVALALCGAAGDQEPQLKANRTEVDRNGEMRTIDLADEGFVLLDTQAARLGAEVLKTSERIICGDAFVRGTHAHFTCGTKQMERNLKKLHPTTSHTYVPDGEREVDIYLLEIGEFVLVGTQAELASRTAAEIRAVSPYAHTAVATLVNGAAKYMMNAEAYDVFMYGALNSIFARGSAERFAGESGKALMSLWETK